MSGKAPFDADLLRFFAELKTHNNKSWFEKNKPRYERVYKEAFSSFIGDFAPRLKRISPHLVADPRPVGGSVMRIYRDTRFSKDKSPYRTYTVVHFGHKDAGEGSAPGLFLYVASDEISAGGGLWHPDPPVAHRIRARIAQQPEQWRKVGSSRTFRDRFEWTGESLKRVPPGFPKDHPLAPELMRKDFVASTQVERTDFLSPNFPEEYERIAQGVAPLLAFLCDATGLPF